MITWKKTERGFPMGTFVDSYDNKCSIQLSSVMRDHFIWIGVHEDRMHLSKAQVMELIPILQHFVATGELLMEDPSMTEDLNGPTFDKFDQDDEDETMEDYKNFQPPQQRAVTTYSERTGAGPARRVPMKGCTDLLPATCRCGEDVVIDGQCPCGSHNTDDDDLLPHNDRQINNIPKAPFPTTASGRVPSPPEFQDFPKGEEAASPGERAFGAKVALERRLSETRYKFNEEDLADFREMHNILDRLHKRHEHEEPPKRQDHNSPDAW